MINVLSGAMPTIGYYSIKHAWRVTDNYGIKTPCDLNKSLASNSFTAPANTKQDGKFGGGRLQICVESWAQVQPAAGAQDWISGLKSRVIG